MSNDANDLAGALREALGPRTSLVHPTYRHLGRPVTLLGLNRTQWAIVLIGLAGTWALTSLLPMPTQWALLLAGSLVGVPAALLHAMQSDRPWTLSMHVRMRDRGHERDRFRRRERVLWGINSSETGRPNRSQHEQEAEVTAIGDELASGGESIADVSLYLSLRELGPEPDARALGEASLRALRTMATPVEAGVQQGECQQPDLWRSSLPLGLDVAARTFPLITRNVADSIPFVSTSSGSPDGIPFAFADPGRTVERINPFDKLHDNAVTLGYAKSGKGKTATVIHLASAAMARGAQVSVIDRSTGHYKFLCSLIPGAAHLELGDSDEQATINCWDVADPGNVPKDKVARRSSTTRSRPALGSASPSSASTSPRRRAGAGRVRRQPDPSGKKGIIAKTAAATIVRTTGRGLRAIPAHGRPRKRRGSRRTGNGR